MERARRADKKSLRSRPQSVRIEFGSGAAASANLCAAAVGTETDGSIVSPSSICGIVGIKPTVGLVSRSGIIPISASQDTAGPMARTVADAAALLTVIAGMDALDPATIRSNGKASGDYTAFLDANAMKGARLGVVRTMFGNNEHVARGHGGSSCRDEKARR